jgi:hypothetical protein
MIADENKIDAKKAWTRPVLTRLDAGSAETQAGATPDGGGGAQGS